MSRQPRINIAGYYHVVNRGVNKNIIYNSTKDKELFLGILNKASRHYNVIVHDYCLMNNHYHFLIETQTDNIGLFMRQINANYAIYFNKKYNRVGHLWQGRYKSWYISSEEYLYTLFKYIEFNPVKAEMYNNVGEYPFSLLGALYHDIEILECCQSSKLLEYISNQNIQDFIGVQLTKDETDRLMSHLHQMSSSDVSDRSMKRHSLESYFVNINNTKDRNQNIKKAFLDGHKQILIAKHLKLSSSAISKIINTIGVR